MVLRVNLCSPRSQFPGGTNLWEEEREKECRGKLGGRVGEEGVMDLNLFVLIKALQSTWLYGYMMLEIYSLYFHSTGLLAC